jgi:arsenate reductase
MASHPGHQRRICLDMQVAGAQFSAFSNPVLNHLEPRLLAALNWDPWKARRVAYNAAMDGVVIYHNPACGTSRNALAMIRNAGIEPTIIEYLREPPDHDTLKSLLERIGLSARELLREKDTPYSELGLGDGRWSDDELIEQMLAHPILINRPIVITPRGAALCRPSERVLDLLPLPKKGT